MSLKLIRYSNSIILFVDGYSVMIIILNYIEEKFMSLEENAQLGEKDDLFIYGGFEIILSRVW